MTEEQTQKKIKDMNLGELIDRLVVETVNYANGQWTSDSPYKSKEQANKELKENYLKAREVIIIAINKMYDEKETRHTLYRSG